MSDASRCVPALAESFEVLEVKRSSDGSRTLVFLGLPSGGDLDGSLVEAYKKLASIECYVYFTRDSGGLQAVINEKPGKSRGWMFVAGLALATFITVYISGMAISDPSRGLLWTPVAYLFGLLGPLIVHEAGHWIVMRLYRVPSSLPYLIPAPPLQLGFLGTFGAVINMRWLPPSMDVLALMAVAGPLAGFIVAIPLAFLGLQASEAIPPAAAGENLIGLNIVPLVMVLLGRVVDFPEGYIVVLSPLAFSSYVVFLVTFLNLIPVGMLDGGHLVRSVTSMRVHQLVSMGVVGGSFAISIYFPQFTLFAMLALLLYLMTSAGHPGSAVQISQPTWKSGVAVLIYSALLVLTFPLPL